MTAEKSRGLCYEEGFGASRATSESALGFQYFKAGSLSTWMKDCGYLCFRAVQRRKHILTWTKVLSDRSQEFIFL